MKDPAPWFQSFLAAELFLQLPFFFYAIYCLLKKSNACRIPFIIYGAHVATTLLPIYFELFTSNQATDEEKIKLAMMFELILTNLFLSFFIQISPFIFNSNIISLH